MDDRQRNMSCGANLPEHRAQSFYSNPPKLAQEINECWTSSVIFLEALLKFCGTSARMAEKFMCVFGETCYSDAASQFQTATRDLYVATASVSGQLKSKLDAWFMGITREENHSHVLAKCYLNLIQLHCQFVVTSTDVLAQFCKFSTIDDMHSTEKLGAEQQLAEVSLTDSDDLMNTWEDPIYVVNGQPSKYGDIGSRRVHGGIHSPVGSSIPCQSPIKCQDYSQLKVTRAMPVSPVKEPRRAMDLVAGRHGDVITQEELDNVINFLSGTRNTPPAGTIPRHLYNIAGSPTSQSDTVSLTSSLGHSMTSSSSSGSGGVGTLNHRLSDGAIDVLREGRNTWPHIGEPMTSQSQAIYGSSTSFGGDPEFLSYVQSVGALIGHSNWSPQHQNTNRSWPSHRQRPLSLSSAQRFMQPPESGSSDGSMNEEILIQLGAELSLEHQLRDTGQEHITRDLPNQQWVSGP